MAAVVDPATFFWGVLTNGEHSNGVTFLFIMTVSDLLEQHCDKSDNAIKLVTSC